MKNKEYWLFNLPLQVFPERENEEDDSSPIVDHKILNYMPRKGCCIDAKLSDLLGDQTHSEFFETAALHFENLAKLMRKVAIDSSAYVYYPDQDMEY